MQRQSVATWTTCGDGYRMSTLTTHAQRGQSRVPYTWRNPETGYPETSAPSLPVRIAISVELLRRGYRRGHFVCSSGPTDNPPPCRRVQRLERRLGEDRPGYGSGRQAEAGWARQRRSLLATRAHPTAAAITLLPIERRQKLVVL